VKRVTDLSQKIMKQLENLGLIVIALATVVAAGQEVAHIVMSYTVTVGDLLLMFIYLEVLSMVRHYIATGTMPVRYPLYIGIVAMTRHIVLDMKDLAPLQVMAFSSATLMLALAILVVRYGHVKFPYPSGDDGSFKSNPDAIKK
jgi:protein PsiE